MITVTPVADSRVKSDSASKNYGSDATVQVRGGTTASPTTYHTYLKFTVVGVAGLVESVRLRLWVVDSSAAGGEVWATGTGWTESGLTWNLAPGPSGGSLGSKGPIVTGSWSEFTLSPTAVAADGTYAFVLTSTSTDSAIYSSREGLNAPQLVVTLAGG